jgi:AcrR family transcriptional regulator
VLTNLCAALVSDRESWHAGVVTDAESPVPSASGVRARVRAELTAAIKDIARRQLATEGAASLSLRAISRELDMASSAIYRYFASRDELLTALIIDAYNNVGAAVEEANDSCDSPDVRVRWLALTSAFRQWAIDNPHEYALIYGSPVPGYAAPQDTIDPATRVSVQLTQLLEGTGPWAVDTSPELSKAMAPLSEYTLHTIPPDALAAGVGAWAQLVGLVTFELFGHLNNVIDDRDTFFDHSMRRIADQIFGENAVPPAS